MGTSTFRVARALICVAMPLVMATPGVARGQDAAVEPAPVDPATEARQQYAAGTQAYGAKKFVEAALHFEAAAAQRAHAVTLYTAALAWEQANRPERACDDYGRALEVPGLSPQQATNARERVATLEKSLGTLAIMAPDGWRVQLLGLTEVSAPARLHATPGGHTLLVRAPNRPIDRRDVTLESGQTTRMEIDATVPVVTGEGKAEPAVSASGSPASSGHPQLAAPKASVRRSVGFGAVGFGVAALGAGIVLGLQAVDARDTYDLAPSRATLEHAQGLQTWTTIAFVAGAAVTVGGVVLVLLPDPAKGDTARGEISAARLSISPGIGGGALRGTF